MVEVGFIATPELSASRLGEGYLWGCQLAGQVSARIFSKNAVGRYGNGGGVEQVKELDSYGEIDSSNPLTDLYKPGDPAVIPRGTKRVYELP